MFVRWHIQSRARFPELGNLLVARIVEPVRIEGKPRQQNVAYLGSIRENMLPAQRAEFWRSVRAKLAELKLSTIAHQAMVAQVAKKVPYAPDE